MYRLKRNDTQFSFGQKFPHRLLKNQNFLNAQQKSNNVWNINTVLPQKKSEVKKFKKQAHGVL